MSQEGLPIVIEFGGGAEYLFDNKTKHNIVLPSRPQWTLGDLILWMRDNMLQDREREDLFVQDETMYEASDVEIVAGSNKLGGIGAVYYQGELFIVHENFTDFENVNYADIALIRLTRGIIFCDRLQPVRKTNAYYPYRNGLAVMRSGWGRQGIPDRTHLNAIRMGVDDFNRCKRLITDLFLRDSLRLPRMDRSMMCLRPLTVANGGTCTGNSGGPYVNDAGYQVGVVSWAAGCGEYAIYGISDVATYVPYYADWIVNKILSFS